jgi:heptosyltransferase-2
MKKKALKDFKHTALIQTAFLGDVVLTLPLVQAIKEINPDIKITFVTTPAAASIVRLADAVDNVIVYDKRGGQSGFGGISFMAASLHDLGVDVVISPHRSLRTTTISKITRTHTVGFDKNAMSFLYSATVKYKPHLHEIKRNLSLLSAFSDTPDYIDNLPVPKITIPESDNEKINGLLKENGVEDDDKIVVLAPGSVWATKKWTEEGSADLTVLLKKAGYTPVLIGAESDQPICDRIKEKSQCLSFAGITSLPQTLALMKKARLAVTNDDIWVWPDRSI